MSDAKKLAALVLGDHASDMHRIKLMHGRVIGTFLGAQGRIQTLAEYIPTLLDMIAQAGVLDHELDVEMLQDLGDIEIQPSDQKPVDQLRDQAAVAIAKANEALDELRAVIKQTDFPF